MLCPGAVIEIAEVPLSDNNTIARCIDDIENVALEKMCVCRKFALQLESTDIRGHPQLLASVRFVDGDAIREVFSIL